MEIDESLSTDLIPALTAEPTAFETLFPELSYSPYSPYEQLTAFMADMSTALLSAQAVLSAIPASPYEHTKLMLFGTDYEFPTISDVEVPQGITVDGMIKKLDKVQEQHQDMMIDYITNPTCYTTIGHSDYLTPISELSAGDNGSAFVLTDDKYKSFIEHLEICSSLKDVKITEDNCKELITKIGYSLVKTLNTRTI